MQNKPPCLTLREAAAVLGVNRNVVAQLLREGELVGRRPERGWMIDEASVYALKADREAEAAK